MSTRLLRDDTVNAFISTDAMPAKGKGSLSGLRFGVKDLYDVAGQATAFGSPVWLRTHPVATTTASCVQALLDAGAEMVGKTHTDELAYSLAGRNHHYGAPVNTRAPGRNTGGSSSGSVSAVAAGLVDFALGSDTGGSVRIPASLCGVYGIRTTQDRIAMDGAAPLAPSFDTCGWFADDAAIMSRVGAALLGDDERKLTPTRLWLPSDVLDLLRPAVREALMAAAGTIAQRLGLPLVHDEIGTVEGGLAGWAELFRRQQGWEAWQAHGDWITEHKPEMGPDVGERFRIASTITEEDYALARAGRDRVRAYLAEQLKGGAVLLLPGAPDVALRFEATAEEVQDFRVRAMRITCIAGCGGLPQVVMPWMQIDGCPVGIGFAAAAGTDCALLALAQRVGNSA
ncbi:amidase [Natronocella acetinitrilica]|uniref:Amidase n=1 Tax=Natronocella acetinitrilica TaxID=414046 RepID=A0AAE3G608_9GAMM|nr:amidase [Natronocella acetinitrilica]MCP1676471.1 amidase [Natronocella acetinitrilica]